jgi:hypothetical protein
LAESFKRLTAEFRELIEEENAIVSERDFARGDVRATAHETYIRNRVVRGTERTVMHQSCLAFEETTDRVDTACFQ